MDEQRNAESEPVDGTVMATRVDLARAQEQAALQDLRVDQLLAEAERCRQARTELEQQALTLEAQLRALEAHAADLQSGLNQAQMALEAQHLPAPQTRQAGPRVACPPLLDVVAQLARSASPHNAYLSRPLSQIRYLVVHHTGSDPAATAHDLAAFHVNDARHGWPGIGFHFLVAADGAIYQTNRLQTISYHVAYNNPSAAGIALAGDFAAARPSEAQLHSTAALLAWLLQELRLPLASAVAHSAFPGQEVQCPGPGWGGADGWGQLLLEQVQSLQGVQRPIYHYLLLWQTADAWAENDLQAAQRYIGRFRPSLGFAVEEARQAENVTIIGGPAGVSADTEETLRLAGCRVQRIAGKNAAQTKELLDTMARQGQRFAVAGGGSP